MAQWERAYLRIATAVAVLLLVGIGLLVSRSGTKTPTSAPTATTSGSGSAPATNGRSTGGSQQAAPPPANSATGSQASNGSSSGSAAQVPGSSGAVGSSGSGAGSAGVQGAGGSGPLPNTGAPFPWWLGLIPLALGVLLIAALRRRPAAALSARSRTVAFDTSIDLPPPSRIRAGERWLFADELDDFDLDDDAERPLVGGRAF